MNIKFDVPYNWDPKIIDYYIDYSSKIKMVYGRAEDGFPQWRKTNNNIDLINIKNQVIKLNKNKIPFNYILNWSSHNNKEYDKKYLDSFIDHIKSLKDMGISIVTIGNPFLIEAAKKRVPDIKISVSVMLEIDCLAKLKQILELWIDYITISKTLLKNFDWLEKISNFMKNTDQKCEIMLLANDPCLDYCPYTNYHNNVISHNVFNNIENKSFCRLQCTKQFLIKPEKIIGASFIRPEDLWEYYKHWYSIIKLCDRKQTTDRLIKMSSAYFKRSYDWYLSDIMAPWSNFGKKYPRPKLIEKENINTDWISKYREYLRFSPLIKNKDLNWYLEIWIKNKRYWCSNENCAICWYCENLATKINKKDYEIILSNINNTIDSILYS